jgi:hypothetical protein
MEKIYYDVKNTSEATRVITCYHNNSVIAELNCYNDMWGDWEEIDMFLESEDLYDVYGEDVEFENNNK